MMMVMMVMTVMMVMMVRMTVIRAVFFLSVSRSDQLVDDFVDGGFLVARARHDVFVIRGNVAAQHRRRLFRLEMEK